MVSGPSCRKRPPLPVSSLLFQLAPVSSWCLPAMMFSGPEITLIVPLCLNYLFNPLVLMFSLGRQGAIPFCL